MQRHLSQRVRLVHLILLSFVMFVAADVLAFEQTSQVGQTGGQVSQATETSVDKQGVAANKDTNYSRGALTVAIVSLIIVGLLFYLLLNWQHRQEEASYLGTVYRDTVEKIEYKRLASSLDDRFTKLDYHAEVSHDAQWLAAHPHPRPPEGWRLGTENPYGINRRPGGTMPGLPTSTGDFASPSSTPPDSKQIAARDQYFREMDEWNGNVDGEARRRYQEDLKKCETQAHILAVRASGDVDLSALRGRGAEFVLGFTTIASIVFAALALGVLRVLDTQQIGTLFAAIAGYVLGRATTGRASQEPQRTQPAPTRELTQVPSDKVVQMKPRKTKKRA